jgi:sialate O-acetylesterase
MHNNGKLLKTMRIISNIVLAASFLSASASHADVRLPKILSDHMVLQRDVPVVLWGWATPGEKVSVEFADKKVDGVADSLGRWSLTLPAHTAGGPFTLVIKGKNKIDLNDILFGDLWIPLCF